MKIKLTCVVSVALCSLLIPLTSFAVSPQATSTPSIEELTLQIKALQAQLAELKAELVATKQELVATKEELRITKTLKRGMADEEVKALQEFLKTLPDIYPEGLVTGYFGPLTEAAVKRLQEANGIETVGIVGPKTRAKLSEISTVASSGGGGSPSSATVATNNSGGGNGNASAGNSNGVGNNGSSTPPGLENREENHPTTTPSGTVPATPAIPAQPTSQTGTATVPATPATPATPASPAPASTPDTTAPIISNIQATNITETSATITWTTGELADSKVYFSPATSTPAGSDAQYVTSHGINLSGLSSSRTYYYVVVSRDSSGNTGTSSEQSFSTPTPPPPSVSNTSPTNLSATLSLNYGDPSSMISVKWFPAPDRPNSPVVGYSILNSGTALGMFNTVPCSVNASSYHEAINPNSYYPEPSPYTYLCNAVSVTPSTNYILTAIARYADGVFSSESDPVSIRTHSTAWRSCSPVAGLNSGNLPFGIKGSVSTPDATYVDSCIGTIPGTPISGNPLANLLEYVCWPDSVNGGALGGVLGTSFHSCANGCTDGACN